jgi:hypothetical protein
MSRFDSTGCEAFDADDFLGTWVHFNGLYAGQTSRAKLYFLVTIQSV